MTQTPEVPIWIHAPVGRDAHLIKSALRSTHSVVRIARDLAMLRKASAEPGQLGVLIVTQEGFTEGVFDAINDHVGAQPAWAELPIVLLVDGQGNSVDALARLQDALPRAKLLVLQRPLRPSEIDSAAEIMRLTRLRQYALRDYIDRQNVLQRELNHRVKNILATVQAMYSLTVRAADDLDGFDELYQGRLRAMADVHDLLHARSYSDALLLDAISSVLEPFSSDDKLVVNDTTALRVDPEAAQSIALMMHELATNAAKYGALRSSGGRVRIDVRRDGDDIFIRWSEETAEPIEPPVRSGYGTTFVQATARSFGGEAEFEYRKTGLEACLRLSAPAVE